MVLVGCFGLTALGQITTTSVAKKTEKVDNTPYDSLQNFLGKDVHKYIGQEFYLNEKHTNLRKYGYKGLIIDYTKNDKEKSNIYKPINDMYAFASDYDLVSGKYFTVLDVIKHPKGDNDDISDKYLYGDVYFIKLKEKESGDVLYYKYNTEFKNNFDFIVVGYFIKQKELNIGKEFVSRRTIKTEKEVTDIVTGKPIKWESNIKWRCIDVTIEEKYYTVSMIIENDKNEKVATLIGSANYLFSSEDAVKYEKKFGKEKWLKILNGSINNGYTEEMVRLAWGEPNKINRSSTGEQWVYGESTYLYFDVKGLLTGFN